MDVSGVTEVKTELLVRRGLLFQETQMQLVKELPFEQDMAHTTTQPRSPDECLK